ncbi:MAG: GC-type dockerin domain-anchored protein [Phycisphaerales bacterium]
MRRLALCLLAAPCAAQPFAVRVIEYAPASGQFVGEPAFNDPSRALGAPEGVSTAQPDNTSVVTLGGVGGSITLAMAQPVLDDPRNPLGLDAIVFGNAFYLAGDPTLRFAEAGLIEIAADVNGNGLADDPFYPVRGPQGFTVPLGSDANGPVIDAGVAAEIEVVWGYADCSPTLPLPTVTNPASFYTVPDDPTTVGIDAGSGGGDAFDIRWAVDPVTGLRAGLSAFDFIRITTAVEIADGPFGEVSTEIDAVADVGPVCPADTNLDGVVSPADFTAWVAAYNLGQAVADQNDDGRISPADFTAWVANYNAGCA